MIYQSRDVQKREIEQDALAPSSRVLKKSPPFFNVNLQQLIRLIEKAISTNDHVISPEIPREKEGGGGTGGRCILRNLGQMTGCRIGTHKAASGVALSIQWVYRLVRVLTPDLRM